MARNAGLLLGTVALLGLIATPVHAASITFNLDCLISGPAPCTPASSAGTLKLTDNGDGIDIEIDVNSGKIKDLYLNVNASSLSGFAFTTSSLDGVDAVLNTQSADGFDDYFDIHIPSSGNLNADPYTTTLMATYLGSPFNLSVTHFIARTFSDNLLLGAIENTGSGGVGWVGAATCANCVGVNPLALDPPPTVTPEPASLFLVGTGLLVAARRFRKRS